VLPITLLAPPLKHTQSSAQKIRQTVNEIARLRLRGRCGVFIIRIFLSAIEPSRSDVKTDARVPAGDLYKWKWFGYWIGKPFLLSFLV
jgi:hypothetical protein